MNCDNDTSARIPTFHNNIDACMFAQANGLRVQYLKPSTGKWTTVRNPRYDYDDDSYRIHPDDVVDVTHENEGEGEQGDTRPADLSSLAALLGALAPLRTSGPLASNITVNITLNVN